MEFNLKDIFRNTFGYEVPTNFSIEKNPGRRESSGLGQPYYASDKWGREFFLPIKINDILISFAVMSMTWKKTFVKTAMPDRGGSVHELISVDDYGFNIKGILVDENDEFPEDGIIELHNLFKIDASVILRSAMSDIVLKGEFDHAIIIKEVKWPATAMVEHVKAFEIDADSDQIFELEDNTPLKINTAQ